MLNTKAKSDFKKKTTEKLKQPPKNTKEGNFFHQDFVLVSPCRL